MITAQVTAFTNPLSTEIGVFRHSGVFAPGVSVGEVKRAFGYELPLVMVNGQMVEDSVQMHEDFSLLVATEAHGGSLKTILVAAAIGAVTGGLGAYMNIGSYAGMSIGSAMLAGAITGAITSTIGLVVGKLIGGGSVAQTQQIDDEASKAFGLSGVRNSARGLGPVNWSFGRTLVSPPLDQRQWVQFVDDGVNAITETYTETVTEKVCSVVYSGGDEFTPAGWSKKSCPAWSGYDSTSIEWVQLGATTIWRNQQTVITAATSSGQDVNSNTIKAMLYDTSTGLFQLEGTTAWGTLDEVHPTVSYAATKTRPGYRQTVELNAAFNFGLGDLVIERERFGRTDVQTYHGVTQTWAVQQSDRSSYLTTHPNLPTANLAAYPIDVTTSEGGELRQNSGVAGTAQEWVVREFDGSVDAIAVDLSGSLFSSEAKTLTCQHEIQWNINDGAWQAAPVGASGVVTISSNSNFPVRETYNWETNSTALRFAVRVRRVTPDSNDATQQSQINLDSVRWMRATHTTKLSPLDLGVAQTRTAFAFLASGQMNGQIDDYCAVVSAKAWVWKGGSVWDGSYPGQSANWSWEVTSNPAWCYAYALQGIHICTTSSNGWCVGPEAATGQRLAGAGVEASLIDWQALIEWAAFCDANGHSFNFTFTNGIATLECLNVICRAGRASVTYAWGKWSIVVERSDSVASRVYGPHNIIADSLEMTYAHPKVDEIVVRYLDSSREDWREDEIRVMVPGSSIPSETFDTTFQGCTNKAQAEKEARLIAARQHWQVRTITFEALNDALLRGDVINVVDSVLGAGQTSRLVNQNGNVIDLAHEVEEDSLDVNIWGPDGTVQTFAATKTGDSQITLSGVPTIDPDSFDGIHEDYIVHMAPAGLQGYKRFRVTSVRPQQGFKIIQVEAVEEPVAMWDWINGGTNTDREVIDRTVARCDNPMIVKESCGDNYYLHWTNEGCVWANVTVNGSTALVNGERMLISGVKHGDVVGVVLTPSIEVATAYKVETTTVQIEVQ